jgi:hypothetical protein
MAAAVRTSMASCTVAFESSHKSDACTAWINGTAECMSKLRNELTFLQNAAIMLASNVSDDPGIERRVDKYVHILFNSLMSSDELAMSAEQRAWCERQQRARLSLTTVELCVARTITDSIIM